MITLLRKELACLFAASIVWTIGAIFSGLGGYFFYTDVVNYDLFDEFTSIEKGLWQLYFFDLRYVALLAAPLLTMRMLAEERKLGTMDLLWSYPISTVQILAAKFLSCLIVLTVILALTAVGPVIFWLAHPFPLGAPAAGYLGVLLAGLSFLACGTLASSISENQVVSAVIAYAILVGLWFLTWNEWAISPGLKDSLLQISMFDRFNDFASGAIVVGDVIFFVLIAGVFLYLAFLSEEFRRRWI